MMCSVTDLKNEQLAARDLREIQDCSSKSDNPLDGIGDNIDGSQTLPARKSAFVALRVWSGLARNRPSHVWSGQA